MFAAGAFVCIVLLYGMSLFIWNIHIEGNESLEHTGSLKLICRRKAGQSMACAKRQMHGEETGEEAERTFPGGYLGVRGGEREPG